MATQQGITNATGGRDNQARKRAGGQDETPPERDEVYGLVSVVYHAFQGAETSAQYLRDAERAGDDELVAFFQECREDDVARAQQAKELLAARLDVDVDIDDDDDEDEIDDD